MRNRTLLAAVALLSAVGCGKGDARGKGASTKDDREARPPPEEDLDHVADHSREPLTTVTDTLGGVRFSIDLPAGLAKEQSDKDIGRYDSWTFKAGNPFLEPSITVQILEPFGYPGDLDAAVGQATMFTGDEQREVATKRATPQGFLVTTQRTDGEFLLVECWARQGDHVVHGSFTQRTGVGEADDHPIPSLPATRAWAETICASLHVD